MSHVFPVALSLAAVLAGAAVWAPPALAQDTAKTAAKKYSDEDLRRFARAYVDFHRLKNDYDERIKKMQNVKDRENLRREGDAKASEVLQKQGYTLDSYSKTFAVVNNNEQLRKKTLKYIEEERKTS
jgi:uncharacterized protein YjeT (DUF2065 family)